MNIWTKKEKWKNAFGDENKKVYFGEDIFDWRKFEKKAREISKILKFQNNKEVTLFYFAFKTKINKNLNEWMKGLFLLSFFLLRKLFQSIRLYIKGILDGQPAPHCLANKW